MDNEKLNLVSGNLHAILDKVIGSERVISINRTATNLGDDVLKKKCEVAEYSWMPRFSGSKGEGFRFKSSDDNWLLISRDIKVIPSDSYAAIYDHNTILLLMENGDTKPGFTLLRLRGEPRYIDVKPPSTKLLNGKNLTTKEYWNEGLITYATEYVLNRGYYLSSEKWRDFLSSSSLNHEREFEHGPCVSGLTHDMEYDHACALQCNMWPSNAHECVKRLYHSKWPPRNTVLSIVNDGVLLVAIGAKKSSLESLEWRISFNLAERKLVYAMNHLQFLCYGLLKIFLKEAIDVNSNVKGLLSSYFLKTVLFWEITLSKNQWIPSLLLAHFWNCFRRIMQWISCSYCPNFFIPENNMFEGKIEGRNRTMLLQHLSLLYSEGYRCLLICPSLSAESPKINNQLKILYKQPLEKVFIKERRSNLALKILTECHNVDCRFPVDFMRQGITYPLLYCLASSRNSLEQFLIKEWLHRKLTVSCMTELKHSTVINQSNQLQYRDLSERLRLLGRCHRDSTSHVLYQAMQCHNAGRYSQALRLVNLCKEKISDPESWYMYSVENETLISYIRAGGEELPMETVRRNTLEVTILHDSQYIPELFIEHHGQSIHFNEKSDALPPFVCAFFLQFLCQRKLELIREADKTMDELCKLVHSDNGKHIDVRFRSISRQVLGICQQMSGDDGAACQSYLTVLCQKHNYFKVATCIRLGTILVKYFKS